MHDALRGDEDARHAIWSHRKSLDGLALVAREGDPDARNALWLIARPHLQRAALGSGVDVNDAPDLVQDTLLAADQNLIKFAPEKGSFRAWLITILVRRRTNLLRGRARRRRLLASLTDRIALDGSARDLRGLSRPERSLELQQLLDALTARQRTVLSLYEIGGLSAREIGQALGISGGGVRSIARAARQRLARGAGAGKKKPRPRSRSGLDARHAPKDRGG